MMKLQMAVELLLHVTHISGTRIQTYIVDILSKYNTLEWVIAGNKLIAYLPFHF